MNDSMPAETAREMLAAPKMTNPMRKRCRAALLRGIVVTDRPLIRVDDRTYQYNEAQAPRPVLERIQRRVARMNVFQLRKHARRTHERGQDTRREIARVERSYLPNRMEILARLQAQHSLLGDYNSAIVAEADRRHCLQ